MAKQGNQFDNDSARRIARTVLRDERRNQGTTGQGRGATPQILGVGYDRCTCQLKGALTTGDSTATVDNVEIIQGVSPLDDPTDSTEELTVHCGGWEGDDNAVARIEYNKTTEHWEFYDIPCPA